MIGKGDTKVMAELTKYPGVDEYFDKSEEYKNSATEVVSKGQRFLVVTQSGKETRVKFFSLGRWTFIF